jgi:Glycosyl transferase family 2
MHVSAHGAGTTAMVSIVINNFNYGGFLAESIESALAQRGAETEVIVVDDGSTDDSRAVIASYGERVQAVLKENGGQASAYNAGFHASHGDVVIFLDADDSLAPGTAARISAAFLADQRLSKVHYRLQVVDEHGHPTGEVVPPSHVSLPTGDLCARILRSPDDVPHPPGSGNAYAAHVLRRLLPIEERLYAHVLADVYLVNLASVLGPVAALDDPGGTYRVHRRNLHYSADLDIERVRATIQATAATHSCLAALAASLGLLESTAPEFSSVTDLALRLISLRIDPSAHPIAGDRRLSLALRGTLAAARRGDLSAGLRLLYALWFAATAVAPAAVARILSRRLVSAWRTGLPSWRRLARRA